MNKLRCTCRTYLTILVPRGCAPFGQHQESQPLAWSNDIPVLNGFVNTIDWDQNQSDLSDLTLNMRRVTGSLWIADFRCWTWPEVVILGADQKERSLWEQECYLTNKAQTMICIIPLINWHCPGRILTTWNEVSVTSIGALLWNSLPENVREIKSVRKFKEQINHLFELSDSHSAVL